MLVFLPALCVLHQDLGDQPLSHLGSGTSSGWDVIQITKRVSKDDVVLWVTAFPSVLQVEGIRVCLLAKVDGTGGDNNSETLGDEDLLAQLREIEVEILTGSPSDIRGSNTESESLRVELEHLGFTFDSLDVVPMFIDLIHDPVWEGGDWGVCVKSEELIEDLASVFLNGV